MFKQVDMQGRPALLLVMEFRVRVLADPETPEAEIWRIIRQSKKLREGFQLTAGTILPEGLGCSLQILDEPL